MPSEDRLRWCLSRMPMLISVRFCLSMADPVGGVLRTTCGVRGDLRTLLNS